MHKIKDFSYRQIKNLFSFALPIIIAFSMGMLVWGNAWAQIQTINILKAQINMVQRAVIDYERANPQDPYPPTIDKLIYENFLPSGNDVGYKNGIFHLYTLWGGEIIILAYPNFYLIQVSRLPHRICQRLLTDLKHSSPSSGCQGDVENPRDWQLRIPVDSTLLFTNLQNVIEAVELPLFLRKS